MERNLILIIFLPLVSFFGFFQTTQFAGNETVPKNPSGYLYKLSDDPKCTDCHGTVIEKQNKHSPAKEACGNCHKINVSEHIKHNDKGLFLTKKIPELCYSCHSGTKKDIDTSKVVHQAINEKKQCVNCHSPHSSTEKKLLTADKKELCLSCHDKDVSIYGKKIINIKQLLKTSKVVHQALIGGCTVCHKPHASTENYLLISAYPIGQYAPGKKDNYAICWECHDSDLLELAKTKTATEFRDQERNLHYLHIIGENGRSCSICHDAHASRNEHLVVDKIPFGEWELPINYIPADNGGSCFPGCHQQYKYVR